MSPDEDELLFVESEVTELTTTSRTSPPVSTHLGYFWKVLLVDDEPSVHDVTCLALRSFEFAGRQLTFLHAYSATEAKIVLARESDIALALVDVVMESEHAGLDLIHWIRNEQKNTMIRLILRTGQPGQAPERAVIRNYDINDYKEKTELSSQKLYTTVLTGLRSYQDLVALEQNRLGLTRVIAASRELFKPQHLPDFIQGVLEQLVAVLYLDRSSMFVHSGCMAMECDQSSRRIIAATGDYARFINADPREVLSGEVLNSIESCLTVQRDQLDKNSYTAYFSPSPGREGVLYFTTPHELSAVDFELVKLFCHNVGIAYQNIMLREEIEQTQREIVYMLGEAIERRSKETGNHVYRVAAYSVLLGQIYGLNEIACQELLVASPLHDFGKIGIPDAILHKHGKLDAEEWMMMKRHSEIGAELLSRSKRNPIRMASIIAGQHHEKWDGSGYPNGLKGESIHLYARIAAIADVFDALQSHRCYKEPWTIEQTMELITHEAGHHFDPKLVGLLVEHLDQFIAVRERYPDPPSTSD